MSWKRTFNIVPESEPVKSNFRACGGSGSRGVAPLFRFNKGRLVAYVHRHGFSIPAHTMEGGPLEEKLKISDAEIAGILSVEEVVDSCDRAFRLYGSGEVLNPPRREEVRRTEGADLFRLEMPAEWPGRYRARKVIVERSDVSSGRLAGRTAVIELEEVATGRGAVLDAEYLTNMRTGAAGALGVRYLAASAEVLAIVGTGRIARALALCADAALGPREIRATSRNPANVEGVRRLPATRGECNGTGRERVQRLSKRRGRRSDGGSHAPPDSGAEGRCRQGTSVRHCGRPEDGSTERRAVAQPGGGCRPPGAGSEIGRFPAGRIWAGTGSRRTVRDAP